MYDWLLLVKTHVKLYSVSINIAVMKHKQMLGLQFNVVWFKFYHFIFTSATFNLRNQYKLI